MKSIFFFRFEKSNDKAKYSRGPSFLTSSTFSGHAFSIPLCVSIDGETEQRLLGALIPSPVASTVASEHIGYEHQKCNACLCSILIHRVKAIVISTLCQSISATETREHFCVALRVCREAVNRCFLSSLPSLSPIRDAKRVRRLRNIDLFARHGKTIISSARLILIASLCQMKSCTSLPTSMSTIES